MKKEYKAPAAETLGYLRPQNLLNTLSTEGKVEDWIQEETTIEEFI